MAAKPVKLSFVTDGVPAVAADIKKVGSSFDDAAADAKAAGSKIDASLDKTAEAADGVASKGSQAAGALTGLGDLIGGKFGAAMAGAGVAFQAAADGGDLLNVVTDSAIFRKVKDTAVTIAQTTATVAKTAADYAASAASKAWAASQAVLNAVLSANPIGLIVAAIALLVGAFVLAYNKSDTFRAIVDATFAAIKNVVSTVLPVVRDFITETWDKIKVVTGAAWGFIKDRIVTPITEAVGAAKTTVGELGSKIDAVWTAAKNATVNAFDTIKNAITGKFNDVVNFISGIPGQIAALGGKFKDAGAGLMDRIIDGIKSAAGFIGDIANTIGDAVKGVINGVIDKVNNALEFTFKVPGLPDIKIDAPNIPHLATGGIVRRPTIALIGEAGPEAVVPLNGRYGMGGGSVMYVTVEATPGTDRVSLARDLQSLLDDGFRAGVRPAVSMR